MAASYFSQIGVHTVTQSSPSPTISCVYNAPHIAEVSRITSADSVHGHSSSSSDGLTASRVLKDVHISARLMDDFLALARDNTDKDLETCGVLGAFLRGGIFHVTTLIIPKQESTSSSCQALYEEEIFSIQHEQSLFPVGWIHTHPSQSCFMSSVDLHTQFSYQVEKERIVLGRKQIGAHGKTCWTWKEFAAHGNDQSRKKR
ncbi:AMSH-like ubiquitin thioesterase 2 isoform X7 [Rhododendron vialii]|uniref:AMSH-like ubiquitin thioesterase 2 isoform X7 n=1 Tax=Rhododendron vialii TaxID=182163 RepID=UPI00265DBC42|nr:AMSH-like ubiquitin thioesterase 2 isoform X7 [Rhododendron vialii]